MTFKLFVLCWVTFGLLEGIVFFFWAADRSMSRREFARGMIAFALLSPIMGIIFLADHPWWDEPVIKNKTSNS